MTHEELIRRFDALPADAQRRVVDFMEHLQEVKAISSQPVEGWGPLSEEPFIGMWRDRPDMANSSIWVRETRKREWMNGDE